MDCALAQWEEKESSTPALQQIVYNTAKTYLGKPDRKHLDWVDTNDQELQTLMSRRDQAHHRVKMHPCTEVRLVGKEGSGAAEMC